ncbi:ion transporter [Halomonas sp. Y3]|uniref:ion transporter n=1 Tax=Halomonas sp. Y3 TaxID=2956797 RepID=UPI00209E4229|nr:ion transporter [Halomonas sp. Y3]
MNLKDIRKRVAASLDPELTREQGLSRTNAAIVVLIALSVLFSILETEPLFKESRETWFFYVQTVLVVVFVIEYLARLWSSTENPRYDSVLHYAIRPASLLDLACIVLILMAEFGAGGFILRLARLLGVLRIARLGRFSSAMELLGKALSARKFELMLSAGAALMLLIISSTVLYLLEASVQPDHFGSIPRSMWWAVQTITTLGYGDVYPITNMGRFFASLTAISGVGLVAMPAGIIAGAVSEAIQETRSMKEKGVS